MAPRDAGILAGGRGGVKATDAAGLGTTGDRVLDGVVTSVAMQGKAREQQAGERVVGLSGLAAVHSPSARLPALPPGFA